jgi:hypothetical protein
MEKSSVGIVPVKWVRVRARDANPLSAASSEGNYVQNAYVSCLYQEIVAKLYNHNHNHINQTINKK